MRNDIQDHPRKGLAADESSSSLRSNYAKQKKVSSILQTVHKVFSSGNLFQSAYSRNKTDGVKNWFRYQPECTYLVRTSKSYSFSLVDKQSCIKLKKFKRSLNELTIN